MRSSRSRLSAGLCAGNSSPFRGFRWVALAGAVLAAAWLSACAPGLPADEVETQSAARILLVGNSLLFYNGGVDRQLKGLAPHAEVAMVAYGGFSLKDHWEKGEALRAIESGGYRFVVLQEQSQMPVTAYDIYFTHAGEFDRAIRGRGGETILLMTWERPDSIPNGVTTANLANAFHAAGAALAARVAPAGIAFANALAGRPDLPLALADGHPTPAGTYLEACVLYAVIFGRSPAGNAHVDGSLSAEDGAYLQRMAAEAAGF